MVSQCAPIEKNGILMRANPQSTKMVFQSGSNARAMAPIKEKMVFLAPMHQNTNGILCFALVVGKVITCLFREFFREFLARKCEQNFQIVIFGRFPL